jgi:L-arabinokinase
LKKGVCFYISGHGFGHASRTMQVIKSLVEMAPEVSIHIKTSTPRWFIESNLSPAHYTYHLQKNDIGVVQTDSLHLMPKITFQAYDTFFNSRQELIRQETEWAARCGVGLIVSDIPPVAFEISKNAQIPGIGITNFSWDWIYEAFLEDFPQYDYLVEQIRGTYGLCDLLYRLPFHGDLSAFPHITDVPLIARTSTRSGLETRRILDLPQGTKLILCSFGGIGIENPISFSSSSFGLIFTTEKVKPAPNTWVISQQKMKEQFICYSDLVAASDAILTKLGYGIVSEAIANKKPLLYADVSAFREQLIFQAEVPNWVPALPVTCKSLFDGGWEETAEKLLEMEVPKKVLPVNGADTIAQDLARIIKSQSV